MTPVCTRRTELLPAHLHTDIFYPDGSLAVPVIRMTESGYSFEKPAAKAAAAR